MFNGQLSDMKKILRFLCMSALLCGLVSCNPETYKKINYLQDINENTSMTMTIIMNTNMNTNMSTAIITTITNTAIWRT